MVWEILKSETVGDGDKRKLIMGFDRVLGLKISKKVKSKKVEIPENIQNLIKERDLARNNKDFAKSDQIRTEIETLGFEVKDTTEGTEVTSRQ